MYIIIQLINFPMGGLFSFNVNKWSTWSLQSQFLTLNDFEETKQHIHHTLRISMRNYCNFFARKIKAFKL